MGSSVGTSSTHLNNRRRRRPYPDRSHHVGNETQDHSTTSDDCHRHQTNDSLPSLTLNYPTRAFGDISRDALLPAPAVGLSSREEAVLKGRNEIERKSGQINNASRQPSWNGRTNNSQYDQAFSSALGKEGVSCPYDRRSGYQRGDEIMGRIANSLALSNKARAGYQGEIPPAGLAARTTGPKSNQSISSGPSAIDLFDQCGLAPSAATGVEGLVGTAHCARASQQPAGGGSSAVDPVGKKAADVGYPLASTLQAARPPIIPDGPLDRGEKGRLRDPRRHEARVRNAMKGKSDAIDGQSRSPTALGHITAASRSVQQGLAESSGREAIISKNGGRKRQGVGNPVESTIKAKGLYRGRSNANLRETQAPAQADRARRRWNVSGDSSIALVPSAPRAGRKEDAPPLSEQRFLTAKVRLHKSKDLSALKSEHMEALSILQDISSPSISAARDTTVADKSGNGVAAQATRSPTHERVSLTGASPNQAFITETASVCPAPPKVEFGPADADVDKLSADLPRIGSQEQAALRSLYRKWWIKIANGGSPPSPNTPNPLEVSKIRKRVGAAVVVDTGRDAGRHRGARPPVGKQGSTRQPVGAVNGKRRVVAKPVGAPSNGARRVVVSKPVGVSSKSEKRVVAKPAGVLGERVSKKQQPPGLGTGTRSRTLGREKNRTGAAAAAFVAIQIALGMAAVLKAKGKEKASAVKSCRGQRTTGKVRQPKAAEKTPQPPPSLSSHIDHGIHISRTPGSSPIVPSSRVSAAEAGKPQQHNRGGVPLSVGGDHRDNEMKETGTPRPALQHDSDVESVSEDNDIVGEQEEGHDGRIFLADGRFISTRRTSSEVASGEDVSNDGRLGGGGVAVDRSVVGDEVLVDSVAEDESLDYAEESFEA